MGVLASLKDLVLRVERYLKYQLYHAQNTYPYPEDQNVAEWVREEGEPNGWTRFGQDDSDKKPPIIQNMDAGDEIKKNKPLKKSMTI